MQFIPCCTYLDEYMKNLTFVRALLFFAALTGAMAASTAQAAVKTQVVDVSGIPSYNLANYPNNGNYTLALDLGAYATVQSISWDVTLTAFAPSMLADLEVHFDPNGGEGVYIVPSASFSAGTASHSGSVNLVARGLSFDVSYDGLLLIVFAESFKDLPDGVAEGLWDKGTLTIGYDDHVVAAVPEPETYAMLLLGLGAVGALARRRTRV